MLKRSDKQALTKDFIDWGKEYAERAYETALEYGVLCSSEQFSDRIKG